MILVQFDDFDALLARISSDFALPIDQVLNSKLTDFAEKVLLNSWSELENLGQSDDLFENLENDLEKTEIENLENGVKNENSKNNKNGENLLVKDLEKWKNFKSQNQIYLASFENLAISKESVEFVAEFVAKLLAESGNTKNNLENKNAQNSQNSDSKLIPSSNSSSAAKPNSQIPKIQIYLYSTKEMTLYDKSLWKKAKIPLEILKINENQKLVLAQNYNQKLELKLTSSELGQLILQTTNFTEIINKMDFLEATENPQKHLNEVCFESIPLLFMLDLSAKNLEKWQNLVSDDNLQLALSLVFGKLEKKNEKLAELVIQTDQKIKTRGKIRPILWWKMLLWQIKNA